MPVRVELLDEAVVDLAGLAKSGNLPQFLKKLLYIEEHGAQAGLPLGKGLASYRKLTVGNRDHRIIFRVNEDETVATVCVIGNREDGACYEEAKSRAEEQNSKEAASLAESMLDVFENRKRRRSRTKASGSR